MFRPPSAVRPTVSRAVYATALGGGPLMLGAYLHAHAAGGPLDHLHGTFDAGGVEVRHFRLGDLLYRGAADLADLLFVRLAGALLDPGLAADEVGGGRALRHECV